ncbi:unnamed protein product, partial [Sphagnum balticum]
MLSAIVTCVLVGIVTALVVWQMWTRRRTAEVNVADRRTTGTQTAAQLDVPKAVRARRLTDHDEHSLPTVSLRRDNMHPTTPNRCDSSIQVCLDTATAAPLWMCDEMRRTRNFTDAELMRLADDVHELKQFTTSELLRLIEIGKLKASLLEKSVGNELKAVHT